MNQNYQFTSKINDPSKDLNIKGENQLSDISSKLGEWKQDINAGNVDKTFEEGATRLKEKKYYPENISSAQEKVEGREGDITDESTWESVKHNVVEVKDAAFKRIEEAVEYITENVSHITHDVRQKLAELIAPTSSDVDKNKLNE